MVTNLNNGLLSQFLISVMKIKNHLTILEINTTLAVDIELN